MAPPWYDALRGPTMVASEVSGMARFAMPKRWAGWSAEQIGNCWVRKFSRTQRWWLGAGTPEEAHAVVVLALPLASGDELRQRMQAAFSEVEQHCRRFDEFGSMQTGTRTTWMCQGNYQISTGHDPERVIFLRCIDETRRAALVMRCHERRHDHAAMRRIERRFFAALQWEGELAGVAGPAAPAASASPASPAEPALPAPPAPREHEAILAEEGPRPYERERVVFTPPDESKVAIKLENMRVLVLDQLRPWRIYRLPRALRAINGRECPAGMLFRFDRAIVDLPARRARIEGLGPTDEPLVFISDNDAHRQWFEFTGDEWRPAAAPTPPPLPPLSGPVDMSALPPGHERAVQILAGQHSPPDWGSRRADADVLRASALALAKTHPAQARVLAEASRQLYHSWMGQATSGGEGAAMSGAVARELQQLADLMGL